MSSALPGEQRNPGVSDPHPASPAAPRGLRHLATPRERAEELNQQAEGESCCNLRQSWVAQTLRSSCSTQSRAQTPSSPGLWAHLAIQCTRDQGPGLQWVCQPFLNPCPWRHCVLGELAEGRLTVLLASHLAPAWLSQPSQEPLCAQSSSLDTNHCTECTWFT